MAHQVDWIEQLVSEVAAQMKSLDGELPLNCHVFQDGDGGGEWEVTVFGEPQSFGGRLKGLTFDARYSIDVLGLVTIFDVIESCTWQTASIDGTDELGPHVAVCGVFQGHRVWLRVLSRAPEKLRQQSEVIPESSSN